MAGPKKINFELIQLGSEPYKLLEGIRDEFHAETAGANIALAWRKELKADKDGHLILGKCVRASDLQRELVDWDFVILLNKEVWENAEFITEKKKALLDHELCHAARATDKDGNDRDDEKGRPVWRIRKHDVEEFREIVERHGCYKNDLEKFAEALLESRQLQLVGK